jgi:hypothetical protein
MTLRASRKAAIAFGALMTGLVGAAGIAAAQPAAIVLPGSTAINLKFQDFETFLTPGGAVVPAGSPIAVGDQNVGIINVTSINNATTGATLWTPGGANGFLEGVFNGITATSITGTSIGNTGGTISLYQVSNLPNFSQGTGGYGAGGCAVGGSCYNGITNVGGSLFLSTSLIPGADTAGDTLLATLATTTVPTSGTASGYGNITGGSAAGQFATGTFTTAIGTPADFSFRDDFCTNVAGCNGIPGPVGDWYEVSNDPVAASTKGPTPPPPVPEPASLALFGTALLGLGLVSWSSRRKHKHEG